MSLPLSFARYIAMSAASSSASAPSVPSRSTATPMDAEQWTGRPSRVNGARSAARMREATAVAASGEGRSGHRTANSSPPKRATVSRPDGVAEPGGDLLQHRVTGVVAECVVDGLEPVEVEEQQ